MSLRICHAVVMSGVLLCDVFETLDTCVVLRLGCCCLRSWQLRCYALWQCEGVTLHACVYKTLVLFGILVVYEQIEADRLWILVLRCLDIGSWQQTCKVLKSQAAVLFSSGGKQSAAEISTDTSGRSTVRDMQRVQEFLEAYNRGEQRASPFSV